MVNYNTLKSKLRRNVHLIDILQRQMHRDVQHYVIETDKDDLNELEKAADHLL